MKPQSEVKCSRVANVKTSKCKVVKSLKPLVNFRFYLDIEKHNVSLKIESKIKELGGSIEFLLTKEVTHFITDRVLDNKETFVNSPQTPASPRTSLSNYSEIGSNASAGNDSKGGGKIKSRADAMLQRARKVTTESDRQSSLNCSPSQVARRWGTPIWHTEYALKYFEKVYNAIKEHYKGEFPPKSKERTGNAKILKGSFIKIEAFHKQYRPYYHLLKGKWPSINLKCDENIGAFIYANDQSSKLCGNLKAASRNLPESKKSQDESNMTRKNRTTKHIRVQPSSRLSSEKQCGFCEICRVEYDVLTTHLKTDEHVNFVKNDRNFLELDSLIKSSANVKFLSINKTLFNGSDCEIFPKRSKRSAAINNRFIHSNSHSDVEHVKSRLDLDRKSLSESSFSRYTRQSFLRQSINLPPPSLTRCDEIEKKSPIMGAVVRARRESVKKINYAEPGEDEENSDDGMFPNVQRKRSKFSKTPVAKPIKIEDPSEPKPKRPLPTVMYKVVESKTDLVSNKKEPLIEKLSEQQPPPPLIVKFRKVRQTELSILNGEAVNFMFPPKMSSDVATDVDRHTTSESRSVQSNEFTSSPKRKSSVTGQNTDDNQDIDASGKRKKPNTTPVFKVPAENVNNVGLESSSCERKVRRYRKRRFPGAPIQLRGRPRIRETAAETVTEQVSETVTLSPPEDGMGEKEAPYNFESLLQNELAKYKFAFERVPHSEPWYDVFRRQDESQECVFEYYGSTVYRKLPYEMGPLPPLPANCSCRTSKSVAVETPTLDQPSSSGITNDESTSSDYNPQTTEHTEEETPTQPQSPLNKIIKRKRSLNRKAALINMEMPRKSPREHPSTLAILSCLINRREEKRKVEKIVDDEAPTPKLAVENCKPIQELDSSKPIEELDSSKPVQELDSCKPVQELDSIVTSNFTTAPLTSKKESNLCLRKIENKFQISPQIGESVKRLRRGEKLLESKKSKIQQALMNVPIKRSVGRPRKNFTNIVRPRKPYELKATREKAKSFYEGKEYYEDVNRLTEQIDLYLSQPPSDIELRDDIPILTDKNLVIDNFRYELDLGNLVFDGTAASDAMNIFNTNTTKSVGNKLRFYKLFAMNKKVKVNRTGWPKKKRVITRNQNSMKISSFCDLVSVDISDKVENKPNGEVNIPEQSPITPPETDVEEKNENDQNLITAIRDENTNLTFASERAENSDMFTVSSDSLDTVLDVGSQIKTEVQKEIIASRKCKVNLSNKLPQDIKIRKSSRICFRRNKQLYLHRSIGKIKAERSDTGEDSEPSSCSPHSLTSIDNNGRSSSAAKLNAIKMCPISPRRLRKPRGRWYRER